MQAGEGVSLKKAVLINAISKYSRILINLLFTAILARILTPEDYGVVAVVTVFTTFFSIFSDMGLGTAVIQNKELTREDTDSIYTFSVYMGIVLCVLFAAFSYPMSAFYDDDVYFPIGCVLAVSLLFNTMNMIPNALLMKRKLFMVSAVRTIVEVVAAGVVTVALALLGYKYYAIAISSVFQAVLTYLWNMKASGLKFHRRIQAGSIQKVLGFSMFQFAFNVVNYFSRNLDNLLTGKFMGSAMLGYYDKAYKLMQYPTSNLTHVITPALHPILSEYQNDRKYIYFQYMKIVKLLAVLGVFASAFCCLGSKELVRILFGSRWDAAIPCFTWLSISVWAQMVTSSSGSIFQSLNETKQMFYIGSFNAMVNVIFILLGVITHDIVKLSMCVGLCYVFHFFSTYFVLIYMTFRMSFLKFLGSLWQEWVIGFMLALAVVLYPFQIQNVMLAFVAKLMFLGTVYAVGLLITKEYKMLLGILRK